MAPDHIDLVYLKVGENHTFASKGIKGLVHVAHRDFDVAQKHVLSALSFHVHQTYGVEANYVFMNTSEQITSRGDCHFVEATLAAA